jgi:isoquinoline 1-oxidoreductase beta subunit
MRGVSDVIEITGGVAVVADNTWRAFRALDAITYDWGPAPYPAEQEDHWRVLGESFTDEHLDRVWRDEGDVEAALGDGEVIEAEYRSPYVAHAPLEPLNAIVRVDADGVEVWTGHQMPRQVQVEVARITGHDPEQVVFHNQYIGGSFGHRLEFEHIKQATEIANRMRGHTGEADLQPGRGFRAGLPAAHRDGPRTRSGRKRPGRRDRRRHRRTVGDLVPGRPYRLSVPGPDSQIAAGAWNNPYAIADFRMRAFRAEGLAPTSSWRAVGAPGAGFIFDTFLDELIHAAGADPMAERIRLMDHDVSRRVLETAAEVSDWGAPLAENQGKGVAFVESFGVPVAEVVQVTNTDNGIRIDKVWAVCDVGTIVDPVNFENLVQGGVVFGLGHAMNCEITYSDGRAQQENYYDHEAMRLPQCPEIVVVGLENGTKIRGYRGAAGSPRRPGARQRDLCRDRCSVTQPAVSRRRRLRVTAWRLPAQTSGSGRPGQVRRANGQFAPERKT